MTTAIASPSVGHGLRSLRSRFKLSYFTSIQTAAPVASNSRTSFQGLALRHETRSNFHTRYGRPNLLSRGTNPSIPSLERQHVLQQWAQLCRTRPRVDCGSPPLRRWKYSYRRFDDDGFDTRSYYWSQLVLFWRSYQYYVMGGVAFCVVFYFTHLEPAPVRINYPYSRSGKAR